MNADIFLSYSRENLPQALALEKALLRQKVSVWRDERSIKAGSPWFMKIEEGIRSARGVAVLVSAASLKSDWVTYEFALAVGARVPVIAVSLQAPPLPGPMKQFQVLEFSNPTETAQKINDGITEQWRTINRAKSSGPVLVARFQEFNGSIVKIGSGPSPSLGMDLWVEGAPASTQSVSFEILDTGVRDRKWVVRKPQAKSDINRHFLTDDINLYGDVEIYASGSGPKKTLWSVRSSIYQALVNYYSGLSQTTEVRKALEQIRKC